MSSTAICARHGPIMPGHEIVGRVECVGAGVKASPPGQRVGVPWLGHTCGVCPYCRADRENLCDAPLFTGYTRDGGYATHVSPTRASACPFPIRSMDDAHVAPLLCAGLIGWRSLKIAGDGAEARASTASAPPRTSWRRWRAGRAARVFAFTRPGRRRGAALRPRARRGLGGRFGRMRRRKPLDAAIIFAPVGALVPLALRPCARAGAWSAPAST